MATNTAQLAICVILPSIIGIVTGIDSCPELNNNIFQTVTDLIMDVDHTPGSVVILGDPSVFTELVGYNATELEDFIEQAMEYYLIRYGLDFSSVEPDDNGVRVIGNAAFIPGSSSDPTFGLSFVSNIDPIGSGISVPQHYLVRIGEVSVVFNGSQILRGTYGGETGLVVGENLDEQLTFGLYYCADCPRGPLTIKFRSVTPIRFEPLEESFVHSYELEHPDLGYGIGRGIFRTNPTDDPDLLNYDFRMVMTFDSFGLQC